MRRLILVLAATLGCLAVTAQEYGVVRISVCNLRDTNKYSAEMVSQALLGTPVYILERGNNIPQPWLKIQTPDGYQGWVHYEAVEPLSADAYHDWNAAPKAIVTALTAVVYKEHSEKSDVISDAVAGDRLLLLNAGCCWLKVGFPDGREGYMLKNDAMAENDWRKNLDQSPEAILATAKSMLGFPYIWAGMSPKGMDCSGFVRTVLFMHDIIIPRDSGPMSQVGQRIDKPGDLQPGDLVFFGRRDNGKPSVSHVGFYLGDNRFIHSLGMVKIGSFSPDAEDFDAYNTGRYLFGGRILPYVDKDPKITTTLTNPHYAE
ncbi:MAG: C40 family peptidase [Bacteroidales bacterium]|nr:C40 family peptidase [Bacteroidales bacterium]